MKERTMRSMLLTGFVALAFSSTVLAEVRANRTETTLHLFGANAGRGTVLSPVLSLQEAPAERKSPALAAIYSLLLPGMGEVYAGGFSSGKYFLVAEGALWLTFATFEVYGNSLRDDARSFAISRAGVNPKGKDDQFYVDIGNFLNVSDFNEKQLRDREPNRLYDPVAGYAWQWESDAVRAEYRAERIRSETMYNNTKFVVAAIIVNRVASAINAARSAIAHNAALSGLSFRAEVMGGLARPHGVMVTVTKAF
jgi:hypothetical protein